MRPELSRRGTEPHRRTWRGSFTCAATALGDWKALLEPPPELMPVLLEMRGTEMIQAARISDAVQAAAKLRELGAATAGQLYNAACVYSIAAAAIQPAEGEELTADQSAARHQHIADALATLRQAIAAGWKDFAHMQKDSDLAPLRDLPEFKKLLDRLQSKRPLPDTRSGSDNERQ